ncbi:GntR family transcriptional regulator, partial [Bradyrhizobium sp. SHOUNA76]|nr:GntR family transcriptional regulator [Bradyrhizobium sp. SHOUNA76]
RSQERFAQNFGAETVGGSSSGRSRTARPAVKPSKPKHAPKKRVAGSGARRR